MDERTRLAVELADAVLALEDDHDREDTQNKCPCGFRRLLSKEEHEQRTKLILAKVDAIKEYRRVCRQTVIS